MSTPQNTTAYIPTPLTIYPETEGWYRMVLHDGKISNHEGWYQNEKWSAPGFSYTFWGWLRPVDLSRMIGEAFDAGQQWEYENMRNRKIVAPNKSAYINSIINPK